MNRPWRCEQCDGGYRFNKCTCEVTPSSPDEISDSEMLDWIINGKHVLGTAGIGNWFIFGRPNYFNSPREAIRAAILAERGGSEKI